MSQQKCSVMLYGSRKERCVCLILHYRDVLCDGTHASCAETDGGWQDIIDSHMKQVAAQVIRG